MLKNIIILVVGLIAGATIFYGLAGGTDLMMWFKAPQTQEASFSTPSFPQSTPQTPQATAPDEQALKDNLEKLRSRLYQEGVTISAVVDEVFPGKGFIVKDDEEVRLFVYWTQVPPAIGEKVTLKGTIGRVIEQDEEFKQNVASPAELAQFLKGQQIFIQAREVNTA